MISELFGKGDTCPANLERVRETNLVYELLNEVRNFSRTISMNQIVKELSKSESKQIQKILRQYKGNLFVKLLGVEENEDTDKMIFEYIEGTHDHSNADLQNFFFQLGKMHRLNQIKIEHMDEELRGLEAFLTILHGDVHQKNIIKSENSFRLIDLTMTKVGVNYDDLDYLDLLNLFDAEKYPWVLKDNGLFDSYLKGAEINLNKNETVKLKKLLTKRFLQKYIENGEKNNIDVSNERALLENITELE